MSQQDRCVGSSSVCRTSKLALPSEMLSILSKMSCTGQWKTTRKMKDAVCAAKNFFTWLAEQGIQTLSSVRMENVRAYYMHRMEKVACRPYDRQAMKLAFGYLYETLSIDFDPAAIFSLKVPSRKPLLPAMRQADIAAMLGSIDRSSSLGKRDYAIILTAVSTGLRAVDIAKIRLRDIDWRNGTINIQQSKTNEPISVPLMEGNGEAIQDYILHARPSTDSQVIFLTAAGKARAISPGSLSSMFARRCIKAGLDKVPHDEKAFHSLRRATGKRLTRAGVDVRMIAQILGHRSMVSSERYISLEGETLRCCALELNLVGEGGAVWE